ncbi:MAG: hypothetical protein M5U34_17465 [Chloroflexi bacterium]|nr:hypothetical protein [Chloroflexota bacterium]
MGLAVVPEERGGLSDGNYFWDVVPSLDGLARPVAMPTALNTVKMAAKSRNIACWRPLCPRRC